MSSHVLFRLPNTKVVHELRTTQSPTTLTDNTDIGKRRGYVFAPFRIDAETPLLLIEPEEEISWILPRRFTVRHIDYTHDEARVRTDYHHSFEQCHAALSSNTLQKIVLSRQLHLHLDSDIDADDRRNLFIAACNNYPHSFVALVAPSADEAWLIATPEVLVEERKGSLHTMALAGTMNAEDASHLTPQEWSEKNQEEQRVVANFIATQLSALRIPHTASAVYPRQAAGLVHLCTDFTIPMPLSCSLGTLVATLHPTPAVCGIPTGKAAVHIHDFEPQSRRYYAGFSGPIGLESGTHLFVTLRCMALSHDTATLYAGGGILAASDEESEWIETRRKMKTMLALWQ